MAKPDGNKDKDSGTDVLDQTGAKSTPPTPPADDKEAKTKTKTKTEKVLKVVARREGFRRAGFKFGNEVVTLRLDDLTDEQVAQLKNEPMLVVTETTQDV